MIEAVEPDQAYGAKTAVDDISFTVQPGQVTGFLGPNGAGKSTTMRMIVGLDRPTRGTCTVNGKRLRRAPRSPHTRWAYCSTRRPSTPAAAPTTTCSRWPRPTASPRKRVDEVIAHHRPRVRREQARRRLLARHGPAPRHRRRPARRPGHPDPGRAGQRPRPRGRASGCASFARHLAARGPHRLPLLAT